MTGGGSLLGQRVFLESLAVGSGAEGSDQGPCGAGGGEFQVVPIDRRVAIGLVGIDQTVCWQHGGVGVGWEQEGETSAFAAGEDERFPGGEAWELVGAVEFAEESEGRHGVIPSGVLAQERIEAGLQVAGWDTGAVAERLLDGVDVVGIGSEAGGFLEFGPQALEGLAGVFEEEAIGVTAIEQG